MKTLSLVVLFAMVFAGYCVGRASAAAPVVTSIILHGQRYTGDIVLEESENIIMYAYHDEKGVTHLRTTWREPWVPTRSNRPVEVK